MADGELQGWSYDPFGLHEARYFSAGRPTKLVRDGNVESYDEPPAGADELAHAAAAPGSAVGWAPQPAGVSGPYPDDPGFAAEAPGRSRGRVLVAVALVTAAALVGGVVVVNGSRSTPNRAPAISSVAFVTRSAGQTMAERTADMTLSGTIQVGGQSVAVSGTGEANFSANAMALDLNASTSSGPLSEKEVMAQGSLFFAFSVDGKGLGQVTGGREWIQMPAQASGSASLTGSDPSSSLSVLEQHGNTVRALGTKIIGGVSCQGYAATPSKQAMIASAKAEIARLGLSSAMASLELSLVQGMSPPTITVWIDAQGLIRQMSMSLQKMGLGSAMSVTMLVDFSHFGAPVLITAPAPSDTISYKSLLQTAGLNSLS
jgi:hypothetical protein